MKDKSDEIWLNDVYNVEVIEERVVTVSDNNILYKHIHTSSSLMKCLKCPGLSIYLYLYTSPRTEHTQDVATPFPPAITSNDLAVRFDICCTSGTSDTDTADVNDSGRPKPSVYRTENVSVQLLCAPPKDFTGGVDVPTCESISSGFSEDTTWDRKDPTTTTAIESIIIIIINRSRGRSAINSRTIVVVVVARRIPDDPTYGYLIRPNSKPIHPIPST